MKSGRLNPLVATFIFRQCGCRFDIRRSDLPLDALMCEHGYSVTAGSKCAEGFQGNVLIGADHRA